MHLKNTLFRKHRNGNGTGHISKVSQMSDARRATMMDSKAARREKRKPNN